MRATLVAVVALLLGCFFLAYGFAARKPELEVIPRPARGTSPATRFQLTRETLLLSDSNSVATAKYLGEAFARSTGWPFAPDSNPSRSGQEHCIRLTCDSDGMQPALAPETPSTPDESYRLRITPSQIDLRARSEAGLFYGAQTLLQLFPAAVFCTNSQSLTWQAPCLTIQDAPRFEWRGLMLDVSRHFFSKLEIEHVLDLMALHKLNRFHWHLTDDQGWRLEIPRYPQLTSVGAWRKNIGFGLDPHSSAAYGPDGRYGGFYTPEDVREIVRYAAARHIVVVPEIEMPGHATAALAAYPQLSCSGGPFTPDLDRPGPDGVFCAGNEQTFTFLENILSEVFELFPGPWIHIGGDEVSTENWRHCAKCQARMKQDGLSHLAQLEHYFLSRICQFIVAHGRIPIGWSEMGTRGEIPRGAVLMDWIGGTQAALASGHDVVRASITNCYLDHYQSTNRSPEPKAIGGYLPLNEVYAYDPQPPGLGQSPGHVLGTEACLWTEYIPSLQRAEYMLLPRLAAFSEVAWSPQKKRRLADFLRRLPAQEKRYNALGYEYRRAAPE